MSLCYNSGQKYEHFFGFYHCLFINRHCLTLFPNQWVMAQYSVGEALSLFLDRSKWKPKVVELRLRQEWEKIVGPTVARYTRDIKLYDKRLTVFTDIAPLKHELNLGKANFIKLINDHFEEEVVTELVIK